MSGIIFWPHHNKATFDDMPEHMRAEVIEQQGLERDLSNVDENLQAFEFEYARLKEALQGVLEPE